jgi:hypothetical protein
MSLVVGYAIIVAGLVVSAAAAQTMFAKRINVTAANQILHKLLAAGNLDRARKLCHAAPKSYFDAVGAAIDAVPTNADADRLDIAAATTAAFDAQVRTLTASWHIAVERCRLGFLLVAGGIALAASQHELATPHLVAGGIALVIAAVFALRPSYMADALASAREHLLPAIADAALATRGGPFRSPSLN